MPGTSTAVPFPKSDVSHAAGAVPGATPAKASAVWSSGGTAITAGPRAPPTGLNSNPRAVNPGSISSTTSHFRIEVPHACLARRVRSHAQQPAQVFAMLLDRGSRPGALALPGRCVNEFLEIAGNLRPLLLLPGCS